MNLKNIFIALIVIQLGLVAGCEHLTPVNNEVRSGGSVLIDSFNTKGATLINKSDLTAELTLDNDSNHTVYNAKIVRLFRAYPDPVSTAARNYSIQSMPVPPVNAGRWMTVVQLVDSTSGTPFVFPATAIPGSARLIIKEAGVTRSTTGLKIIEGQTSPNRSWSGSNSGLGFRLSPNPHALVKVTNLGGATLAGAKFVITYDAETWTNLNDEVLKDTGQSMMRVTKAVIDPYINLATNEVNQGATKQITILFSNVQGFQPFQYSSQGRFFLEDGKSHNRDVSTVVLTWFMANGLTEANFGNKMILSPEYEIFDIDGNIIENSEAALELLRL